MARWRRSARSLTLASPPRALPAGVNRPLTFTNCPAQFGSRPVSYRMLSIGHTGSNLDCAYYTSDGSFGALCEYDASGMLVRAANTMGGADACVDLSRAPN